MTRNLVERLYPIPEASTSPYFMNYKLYSSFQTSSLVSFQDTIQEIDKTVEPFYRRMKRRRGYDLLGNLIKIGPGEKQEHVYITIILAMSRSVFCPQVYYYSVIYTF